MLRLIALASLLAVWTRVAVGVTDSASECQTMATGVSGAAVADACAEVLRTREPGDLYDALVLLMDGITTFDRGDPAAAIGLFSDAISINDQIPDAYYNRGNAHTARGDYAQAVADFDQAVRLEPNFAYAFNNRGWALLQMGNPEAALADFSHSVDLDPTNVNAWMNRGFAYTSMDEHESAANDYAAAARVDPLDPSAPYNEGLAYMELGWDTDAVAAFDRLFVLQPNDPRGHLYRSLVQCRLGNGTAAFGDWIHVLASGDANAIWRLEQHLDRISVAVDLPPGAPSPDVRKRLTTEAQRVCRPGLDLRLPN